MRSRLKSLAILCILLNAGCASQGVYHAPSEVSHNHAVNNMYSRATENIKNNNYDGAQAHIERALRIEPDNPFLWFELAQLAQYQGDPLKAKALANRAHQFAVGSETLQTRIKQFLRNL